MANIDKITLRGVNYPIIDSSVPAYVRGITQTDITNWNNKLDSFTETDPTVPSYVKGITESDITNWNNKLSEHQDLSSYVKWDDKSAVSQNTDTLSMNRLNIEASSDTQVPLNGRIGFIDINRCFDGSSICDYQNGYGDDVNYSFNREVSGDVAITKDITQAINSYVISASYINSSSLNTTLASYVTSGYYDTSTHKIYLRHGTNVLSEIDANDFIKDGMVDTAYVQGSNLVISFNTDAGKQPVEVPIADIFNPTNYYTKTEINNAGYLTSHQDLSSYVKWNENYAEMLNINVIDDIDRLMFNSSGGQYLTTNNNKLGIGNSGDTDVISFPDFTGSNRTIACVDQLPNMSSYVSKTELNNASYVTQTSLSNNSYVTQTSLSNNSYVTQTSLSNNSYITATQLNNAGYLTAHQSIKTINGNTITGTGDVTISGLPEVNSTYNGKILQVVDGEWALVTPLNLYSGTGTPNNTQGNNGDLYMQI